MRSKNVGVLALSIALYLVVCGCAKRYVVRTPTVSNAPSAAERLPECKAYRLFNAGLAYIPFDQLGGQCGEPHAIDAAILLEPGMKLRISEFSPIAQPVQEKRLELNGAPPAPLQQLRMSQVPSIAQFEWTKPRPDDSPTRADYFFLSYLAAASFPFNRHSTFHGCDSQNCDPHLTLQSLRLLYGIGSGASTPPEHSAEWVREILNPSSYSPSGTTQSLSLSMNQTPMKAFNYWDDPWFMSSTIDENNDSHGISSLYQDGYSIYAGHALAEIQIPIKVDDRQAPTYVPIYWSIADAEKELGVSIVGIRRRMCYLTETALRYLEPSAHESDLASSVVETPKMPCTTKRDEQPSAMPQIYFTLWFKKPSWTETRPRRNGKSRGYVVLTTDFKKDTNLILDTKKKLLLAPGDILLLAR